MPGITGAPGSVSAGTVSPARTVSLSGWFGQRKFVDLTGTLGTGLVGTVAYVTAGMYDWLLVDNASRLHPWPQYCGIPGGIPARTTIYTTLGLAGQAPSYTQSVTAAQITTALTNCPADQTVYLYPGTYSLGNVTFPAVSGKTLRGAGPGQTILRPSSTGNFIRFADSYYSDSNARVVSSGYIKGSTAIVLATAPGATFAAGNLVMIVEDNSHDKFATDIGVYLRTNETYLPTMYATTATFPGRNFTYTSRITSVSGNTINLATPIPLSFSTTNIKAYPPDSSSKVSLCGIENLTIDGHSASGGDHAIYGYSQDRCWVKDVEIKNYSGGDTGFIGLINGFQCEVRRCYIHDCVGFPDQADGQGVCFDFFSSNCLLVDTIAYRIASITQSNATQACAIAYNLSVDLGRSVGGPGQTPAILHHAGHGCMNLIEGNICNQFMADGYHGSMSHEMIFRNNFHSVSPGRPGDTWLRMPITLDRWSYYFSCVGNVLGDSSWTPTAYEVYDRASWDSNGKIYGFGFDYTSLGIGCSYYTGGNPDMNVPGTVFRHGNYDYFNHAPVWDGSIVSHSIPDSLLYSSKPAWFGSLAWPAIGPDLGTMVNDTPAKRRWDNFVISGTLSDLFADAPGA